MVPPSVTDRVFRGDTREDPDTGDIVPTREFHELHVDYWPVLEQTGMNVYTEES